MTALALPDLHAVWHAFLHVYHQDHANASMHCAPVRYSPLTFRLAELLERNGLIDDERLKAVVADLGKYEEDPGRP